MRQSVRKVLCCEEERVLLLCRWLGCVFGLWMCCA